MSDSIIDDIFGSDETEPVSETPIDPTAVSTQSAAAESDEDTDEVSAGSAEDQVEEEPKAAAPEGSDAEAAEAVPAAIQAKKVAFKVGDTEVPLDETASIEHRVDGKKVTITLKDLITNYAGKIPIERRMQELAEQRKVEAKRVGEFEAKQTRHTKMITDMFDRMSKGDLLGAVAVQLEAAGRKEDPREVVRQLRAGLMEQAKKLAAMTPEQQALYEHEENTRYLQSKYDQLIQQRDTEKAQAEFQQRVVTAMGRVNATMEDYVQEKSELEREYAARKMDASTLTPEKIADHIQNKRDYMTARDALNAVDPEFVKNEKLWDHAVYLLRTNPTWTQEDLQEVFRQAAAQKRGAAVSKKVTKAPIATVAAAAAKAKAAPKTDKQKQLELILRQDPSGYGAFSDDDLDW